MCLCLRSALGQYCSFEISEVIATSNEINMGALSRVSAGSLTDGARA